MIHNLIQYLKVHFPSISFVKDGWNSSSPMKAVLVSLSGGTDDHYTGRIDYIVQVTSRDKSIEEAHDTVMDIYSLLKNRFGLVLPEVKVKEKVYPEIKTYRIVPVQFPSYMGASNYSLHAYTFSLEITLDYS